MDIKQNATYPYPIWGLYDDFKGDLPSGQRIDFHKDVANNVFVLEYEVTSHNEGVDKLIEKELASYLCIIQCRSTYYTQIKKSSESKFKVEIPCDKVSKRFSVKIEIVAIKPIIGCDFLDVDDFYEGIVDYQKGAMIAMVDKFNVSLTPGDDMANLSRIVEYEYANVQSVTNDISDKILIKLPYSYESSGNLVLGQCSNVFEAILVRNALIEAIYMLRDEYGNDHKDWVFYTKQFVDNLVSEGEIPELENYDYDIKEILFIVDRILPDVMLSALDEVKDKIEQTNNR